MAVSEYQRQRQTELFARRAYDKAAAEKKITKNTEKLLNDALKAGKSPDEIKKILANEARKAENYARTAARTDATRVENQARDDAYQAIAALNVYIIKKWDAIIDSRTRASHDAMNGEEQFAQDEFSNGGMYPGDPKLPPRELYNCRCTTQPEVIGLEDVSDEDKSAAIGEINALIEMIRGEW